MGEDLLALAELMATLSDWFVICQRRVPRVRRLGVSMPAVTTRLEMMKQDMRKGRKTGWPVSGCRVLSTTFLACHSSGVICGMVPDL